VPSQTLRWRSQFAPQPSRRFTGFHRIHESDQSLMNVITRGALECSDTKARGTGCDAGEHGSCLARGAKWPEDDHDARLGWGGSVTELSVTGRCRYGAV